MALTTRVWSAGKLLLLVGALVATYVALCGAVDAGRAARPRGEGSRLSPTAPLNEAPARPSADLGLALKVDDSAAARSEDCRRPHRRAGPAGRLDRPAQRSVKVWLSPGRASRPCRALDRRDRADRAAAAAAGRPRRCGALRDPVARLPGRRRRRAGPAGRRPRARQVSLLVNRGERGASYVMPDLIGVNGDARRRRPARRGFRVAVVGVESLSRRRRRRRPAAEPAGRLPDCARRADLARGQPMSVRIAPSILVGRLRRARRRDRGRRARRRRPDPRRRDGRPLRPEHHHRPAGRASRSSGWPRCRSTCT